MGKKVMVFVGTQKGGFIFDSNAKRKKWQVGDIHFKSWNVMHMQLDPRDQRLHAATSHFVYGPTTHYSDDFGKTWTQNESLYDHPQRGQWNPGAGGLTLHTILLDPTNLNRMYIAVSAAGCYRTDDGGATWSPYNKNVRADFMGTQFPEFGQCVHKMVMHPSNPNVIYQQNHCGVYRSDNAGEDWIDIGEGRLPSRFGFPIAVHPTDPRTIYIALEESDQYRMSVDGKFSVWRSRDAGDSWERMTKGLPEKAHLVVLREAMATDSFEDAGIYVGTNTGQLFYSRDSGDSWDLLADFLPPIHSVEAARSEEHTSELQSHH